MQSFALAAIGLLFGIVLCLLSFAAFLLYRAAQSTRESSAAAERTLTALIQHNSEQMHALRTEVSGALTKLDAAQLHEAATLIRRDSSRLARTVAMLYKLAFAQGGTSAAVAEDLAERDINPSTGTPYVDDLLDDVAAGRVSAENYAVALRQRAASAAQTEDVVARASHPLPDISDAWAIDEREFAEEGPGA